MTAKIVPPSTIVNRKFVLEEYLALRESVVLIPVETDLTDEAVSDASGSLASLQKNLDEALLPIFRLSDKRAWEGVPPDYFE